MRRKPRGGAPRLWLGVGVTAFLSLPFWALALWFARRVLGW